MKTLAVAVAALCFTASYAHKLDFDAFQQPLAYPSMSAQDNGQRYEFGRPIKRVAIIGAGVGGLIAYRELSDAGFDVHIYERDNAPGGNWHYTDETAVDTPIPSSSEVSKGDYEPWLPPKGHKGGYSQVFNGEEANVVRRSHRAPKPLWKSLTSNAPAPVQQIREWPWPSGTPWALPNQKLQRYLRAFATWHGVNSNDGNSNSSYNTRLELATQKEGGGWKLTFTRLEDIHRDGALQVTWIEEDYDALVVATGRYNSPNVPRIEGIEGWTHAFPGRIRHSRQYRVPEPYMGRTVLIVGAATSGGEISRDIIYAAKKVYQSIRPESNPLPERPRSAFLSRIPSNVTIVPEIKRFLPPASANIADGQIELSNGTVISGIDDIIFATGYRYTYPFLPQFHNSKLGYNDHVPRDDKSIHPIVTDGTHLRSLYLDAFYILDPTLAFINANTGIQSFTYAEFVSLAIAKVWSRTADLPSCSEMWKLYDKSYEIRGGYSKNFQFLGAQKMAEHLRFFQGWLNAAAVRYGGKMIDGLSKEIEEVMSTWARARHGGAAGNIGINRLENSALVVLGLPHDLLAVGTVVDGTEGWAQDIVFDDRW